MKKTLRIQSMDEACIIRPKQRIQFHVYVDFISLYTEGKYKHTARLLEKHKDRSTYISSKCDKVWPAGVYWKVVVDLLIKQLSSVLLKQKKKQAWAGVLRSFLHRVYFCCARLRWIKVSAFFMIKIKIIMTIKSCKWCVSQSPYEKLNSQKHFTSTRYRPNFKGLLN